MSAPNTLRADARMYRTHKLFRYFEKMKAKPEGLLITILVVVFVRLCVGIGPYSGQNKPPMYGDFEAQRHWMEITINIPIEKWYVNGTNNDLQYWGLDYPPLTSYHSWILGKIASYVYPPMVELNTSHGIETDETKFFMRMSVIASELITFIPAVFIFFLIAYPKPQYNWSVQICAAFTILISPLYTLIDHGHTQYNGVALGLTLFAIELMFINYKYLGSILFVLAIGFKQMSLWYSLPFFCFCVGKAFAHVTESSESLRMRLEASIIDEGRKHSNRSILESVPNKSSIKTSDAGDGAKQVALDTTDFRYSYKCKFSLAGVMQILCYAVVVLSTVFLLMLPWILEGNVMSVVHRMFPFNRGLFEDKVSNFWCATNIAFKWRERFGDAMKYISLMATLLSCLPSSVMLILQPKPKHFIYSLASCSLGFYLFSFQVHEKNIQFPMLPISLLILEAPYFVGSLTWIATFSMLPLLVKDDIMFYYWILQVLFYFFTSCIQPITTMYRSVPPPIHPLWLQLALPSYASSAPDVADAPDTTQNDNKSADASNDAAASSNKNNKRGTRRDRYYSRKSPKYSKTPFNTPQRSLNSSETDLNAALLRQARRKNALDEGSEVSLDSVDSVDSVQRRDDGRQGSEPFVSANESDVTSLESKNWKNYIESKGSKTPSSSSNADVPRDRLDATQSGGSGLDADGASDARHGKDSGESEERCYGSSASEGFAYAEFPHAAPLEKYSLYWSYSPLIAMCVHMASKVEFSSRYPDIGTYMIVIFSFGNFLLAWVLITVQHVFEFSQMFNDSTVLLGNELEKYLVSEEHGKERKANEYKEDAKTKKEN